MYTRYGEFPLRMYQSANMVIGLQKKEEMWKQSIIMIMLCVSNIGVGNKVTETWGIEGCRLVALGNVTY